MRDESSAVDPRSWFRAAPKNGSAGAGADDDLDIYEPADGSAHPKPEGFTQLNPHGTTYGIPHGKANGFTSATRTAEEILGLRFYKDHRGVVRALQPDEEPPLHPKEAVSLFIAWLQSQPPFPGSDAEAGLLRDKLWPAFYSNDERIPDLAWHEVSARLVELGCKKRQPDGRCGSPRDGVQSPVLYRIPKKRCRRRRSGQL